MLIYSSRVDQMIVPVLVGGWVKAVSAALLYLLYKSRLKLLYPIWEPFPDVEEAGALTLHMKVHFQQLCF